MDLLVRARRAALVVALAVPLVLAAPSQAGAPTQAAVPVLRAAAPVRAEPLYGDTLTNAAVWGKPRAAVRGSRQALGFGRRLTHRIVFDPGTRPVHYAPAINALSPYSDILGEIVDSYSMRDYTRAQYVARTRSFMRRFGRKIDIYEIGNEINGEWLGRGAAGKAHAAFHAVDGAGHATALTPYYNPRCWSRRSHAMLPWLRRNIPADMKAGIDYVLVSYYERDCDNHRVRQAEMDRVFARLHRMFPHAKLGWGEVGLRRPVRRNTLPLARNLMRHYYGIKPSPSAVPADQYVTGGFWWFGQQDLHPTRKPLWRTFKRAILAY